MTKGWASWGKSWCIFLAHYYPELTYPTWGKGKSSSKLPLKGDMFVPRTREGSFFFLSWKVLLVGERFMLVNEGKGYDMHCFCEVSV